MNELISFLGFWHGCPRCFPGAADNGHGNHRSIEEKYQETLDKENFLKDKGYTVETMWECDLTRSLNADKKMTAFFKELKLIEPLKPRDGFFGGRTDPVSLLCEPTENQRVDYVDVCR